jgi:methanogenic corrinoid protein MtbC1
MLEGEVAYKESNGNVPKNNDPSDSATRGNTTTDTVTSKNLSLQDLTVLEKAVRSRVSNLVGAMHPAQNVSRPNRRSLPSLDDRLHPELNEIARRMPAVDKAISYRGLFLNSLIDPDPRHHRNLIDELLESDIPLQTMAIHLLCPLATELGNYWCNDDADFMQVAVASTRLSNVVNHLIHSSAQNTPKTAQKRILLAKSHGTKHTLGVNLVTMCFRDMGWIVDGGADLEIGDSLFMKLSSHQYNLLGLSIGQLDEVQDCEQTIDRYRSVKKDTRTRIAIGGAAVLAYPDRFKSARADIVARSAMEVLSLAEHAAG